jgi:thiol-disulfide isomerase/thioredoxin
MIGFSSYSQKTVTISGKIKGLRNSKIYLGNKPNGINKGFHYIIYDSILSRNGNFKFKDFKFKEIAFYSIQIEGSQAWLPFVIDTGHICINAKKDSIYVGKISGSKENDLYLSYKKNLTFPFYKASQANFDSMDKYRNTDTSKFNHYSELIKKSETIYINKQKNFIKKYPNKFVSLIILNNIKKQVPKDSLELYFNLLSFQLQNNSQSVDLKYQISDFSKNTMFGSTVPDFQFRDIDGNKDNLYDIQAPFKLIDFWASWCAPCLAELPALKALHNKNKNVAIISFSIDYDKVAWKQSSKENGISWYSFSDSKGPEGKFAAYFGVQQIPLMILLDSNNRIIKYDVNINELKNYIEKK